MSEQHWRADDGKSQVGAQLWNERGQESLPPAPIMLQDRPIAQPLQPLSPSRCNAATETMTAARGGVEHPTANAVAAATAAVGLRSFGTDSENRFHSVSPRENCNAPEGTRTVYVKPRQVVGARDLSAFSPYAPRLGHEVPSDDDVAGVASTLERLRFDEEDAADVPQASSLRTGLFEEESGECEPSLCILNEMNPLEGREREPEGTAEIPVTIPVMPTQQPNRVPLDAPPATVEISPTANAEASSSLSDLGSGAVTDESRGAETRKGRNTLVVYPGECLLHMGGKECEDHQETPRRLELLCGERGALRRKAFQGLEWADPSRVKPAIISDLLRVHDYEYLQHLEERCREAPPCTRPPENNSCGAVVGIPHALASDACLDTSVGAVQGVSHRTSSKKAECERAVSAASREDHASPRRQRASPGREFGDRFRADAGYMDVDTRISKESYLAARMAAGAVIHAVDEVMQGSNPNAFVAVRPPGHHAGPSGSVPSASFWRNPGMNSSGFCLLNNAAIGGAYARCRYGRSGELSRVAIVDIDIHHGNGTEAIVRSLRPMVTRLPLPPSWPPVMKTVYKPWLDETDADNVFFGSVSLQDNDLFYPASGTEGEQFAGNAECNIVNVSLSPLGPPPGEEAKKRALTKSKMALYSNKARAEFKDKCQRTLLAGLKDFAPDLLIISAGFDGHLEDYYYFLTNDTYEWITLALEECCPSGRVVSVLEGGYSLESRESRAKAAQQARASVKRASRATASTPVDASVASGPALRERRSRPATRGSSSSSGGGNNSASSGSTAPAAAAAGKSDAQRPAPVPIVGADAKVSVIGRAPKADNVILSPATLLKGGLAREGAGIEPAYQGRIAAARTAAMVPGSGDATRAVGRETMVAAVMIPCPSGPPPAPIPGDPAPGDAARVHVPSANDAVPTGAARQAVCKADLAIPPAAAVDDDDLPTVRPEDGGLVRGVVSHVTALMAAAERRRGTA